MNRPRLLSGVSLVAGLALLLVTHRAPAPPVPTLRDEIAATRLEVARLNVQLRHAQAEVQALRTAPLRKKESGQPPTE